MRVQAQLKAIWNYMRQENMHRLLGFIVVLTVASSFSLAALEPGISLGTSFWWSIVTLTTVGYGDVSPVTFGGRIIAIVLMIVGIGLLGTFSATIASFLVDKRIKENRGMSSSIFEDHIIICEWNHRAEVIISELRHDRATAELPIVLISNIEQKPIDDERLLFIQGQPNDETFTRANLAKARTVVILGDDRLEHTARDAKAILTILTAESINPDAYTIVELVNESNVVHCQRANADEIIVSDELSSNLISRAAVNHGISGFVSELLSAKRGNELYKVPVPSELVGSTFLEAILSLKQQYQCIAVGVQKQGGGALLSNPASEYLLDADDYLIVIAHERPLIE